MALLAVASGLVGVAIGSQSKGYAEKKKTIAALAVGGQSDIVPRVETPADLETLATFHRGTVSRFVCKSISLKVKATC